MNSKSLFSYSRINTFENCPQKYKIQYLDKISNKCNSIEAYMGQRVHQVLEDLYNINDLKNTYISFDQLMEMYYHSWEENWNDNIFISKFKYDKKYYNKLTVFNNGLICLKNYYKRFSLSGYFKQNVYETELEIKVKIGNYKFRGFIDRVDIDEKGNVDIIDYKTSNKSKGKIQASNDLQLAIYSLAIRKIIKNYKKINLHLHYLKNDNFVTFEHSCEKILKLESIIINKIEKINQTKDYIAKESILCEWCYYWKECDIKLINNPSIRL